MNSEFKNKTFWVTGATGRLGCACTERLHELGADVVPIILPGYPDRPKRVEWPSYIDAVKVSNYDELCHLSRPDYVIHFHWLVNRKIPEFTGQIAYELFHNLFNLSFFWEWLKNNYSGRFINISSTKIFSHLNTEAIITAETSPRPATPYGIAKSTTENFINAFFSDTDVVPCHVRPSSVASVGEHESHLMTRFIEGGLNNNKLTVNSGHKCYLLFIDEAIDLILSVAISSSQKKCNLLGPGLYNDEIAGKVESILGTKLNADYIDLSPGICDPEFETNLAELKQHDWFRNVTFDQMVAEYLKHYRQQRDKG
jgi:nucleoside-diphosphate-sugar epimerase